tara:strand:- start:371 stop:850 length:480 start_codon:yes stop_codon:yes gene_type:complete
MIHLVFDLDNTIIIHNNNINYDKITENKKLTEIFKNIKYPIYIYTNGTFNHAKKVLINMNILQYFDKIYSRDTLPYMKPDIKSFQIVNNDILNRYNDNNNIIYFFDDLLENHKTSYSLNWKNYYINTNYQTNYFIINSYNNITDCLIDLNNNTINIINE